MVESETRLAHIIRTINEDNRRKPKLEASVKRLEKKRKSLKNKVKRTTDRLEHNTKPASGHSAGQRTFRKCQSWLDKKRLRNTRERLATTTRQYNKITVRTPLLEKHKKKWVKEKDNAGKRLANLGTDVWSHMRDDVWQEKAGCTSIMGILICAGAFVAALAMEANGQEPWTVLLVVLGLFFVGTFAFRNNSDAFTAGASVICFIGLDTIELSPYNAISPVAQLSDLYDSQTVVLMFMAVALVLSVHGTITSPRTRRDGDVRYDEGTDLVAVEEGESLADRRQRWWLAVLSASYLLLVCHTIGPALWQVFGEDGTRGVVSVTSVASATLFLPVIVLWKRQSDDGGRSKE